jgi:hypothetical protein
VFASPALLIQRKGSPLTSYGIGLIGRGAQHR